MDTLDIVRGVLGDALTIPGGGALKPKVLKVEALCGQGTEYWQSSLGDVIATDLPPGSPVGWALKNTCCELIWPGAYWAAISSVEWEFSRLTRCGTLSGGGGAAVV